MHRGERARGEGEDSMSGGTLARDESNASHVGRGRACNSSFSFRSEPVTSSYLGEGTNEGMV